MLKILVVEDEELIRKGIVLAVDWAALDCVVVGEASQRRGGPGCVERLSPSPHHHRSENAQNGRH